MSVSQFPNANDAAIDMLVDLVNQLIGSSKNDPVVNSELTVVYGAYMCAATEVLLGSKTLQQHILFDPHIVKQIEDLLKSCS